MRGVRVTACTVLYRTVQRAALFACTDRPREFQCNQRARFNTDLNLSRGAPRHQRV